MRASVRIASAAVAAGCGAGILLRHAHSAARPVASAARLRAIPAAVTAAARAPAARAHLVGPAGIRRDLFGAPAPAAPAPVAPPPARTAPKPHTAPTPPAPPPDPLAPYVYDGVARIGDERYALVEDRDTRAGHYLRVGDALAGLTVASFDATTLRLAPATAGQQRTLAMNDDYSLIPLDKRAGRGGHSGGAPPNPVTTVERVDLGLEYSDGFYAVGGDDVRKLGNDLFDGRITQEQFDQRVGAGNALRFTVLTTGADRRLGGMEVRRPDVVLEDAVSAPSD